MNKIIHHQPFSVYQGDDMLLPSLFGEGLGVGLCLPYIILRFIINHVILIIASPRNSVRVVFLIARGWRGTSLPRVNVRKEIQRRRC